MNQTTYNFRGYFKTMSFIGAIVGAIAAILQFILGNPVAFVMLFICVLSIFQISLYSKPFIEIQGTMLTARLTVIITKTIDLASVTKIETPKNKKIILYPKEGKKLVIPLGFLSKEDQELALVNIPAIVHGKNGEDFVAHLIED